MFYLIFDKIVALLFEKIPECIRESFQSTLGIGLAQVGIGGNRVNEFRLVHCQSRSGEKSEKKKASLHHVEVSVVEGIALLFE